MFRQSMSHHFDQLLLGVVEELVLSNEHCTGIIPFNVERKALGVLIAAHVASLEIELLLFQSI